MTDKVMKENKSFEFTYSAKQQQEIESIRKKYIPKKEDKMETLRRLDREAERPGVITALAVGIMGTMLATKTTEDEYDVFTCSSAVAISFNSI